MAPTNEPMNVDQVARIAVYDDLLSAPRVVDIPPSDVATYIDSIAKTTWEMAQALGGSIPYTVIREVSENFIHAQFKEITVSVLDRGCTIRFADQGPGISDKEHAQLPGFSSATNEMKEFIRGVGSGLPIVKEYLKFSNGRLVIEDNIKDGTVITIAVDPSANREPVVYQEAPAVAVPVQAASYAQPAEAMQPAAAVAATQAKAHTAAATTPAYPQPAQAPALSERSLSVLVVATEIQSLGPTEVSKATGLSVTTAHRELSKLGEMGYLMPDAGNRGKYLLTQLGLEVLREG